MKEIILAAIVASQAWSLGTLLFSIARPSRRIWPLAKEGTPWWRTRRTIARGNSVLIAGVTVGLVALSVLDWNRWVLQHGLRFVAAAALVGAASWLALGGALTLGFRSSRGHVGALTVTGPYRYSRNPQYVGTVAVLLAWVLVSNSAFVAAAAILPAAWFLLAPLAEESWCREELGPAYERYARATPRYLGLPKAG